MWLFHFWGTVWGEILTAVLQANGLYATFSHEYALYVESHPQQLPACDLAQLERIAQGIGEKLGARLGNGRFYTLLPPSLAKPALLKQLNLPHLHDAYSQTRLVQLPKLHKTLHNLT